jgi:hypothetical protein
MEISSSSFTTERGGSRFEDLAVGIDDEAGRMTVEDNKAG